MKLSPKAQEFARATQAVQQAQPPSRPERAEKFIQRIELLNASQAGRKYLPDRNLVDTLAAAARKNPQYVHELAGVSTRYLTAISTANELHERQASQEVMAKLEKAIAEGREAVLDFTGKLVSQQMRQVAADKDSITHPFDPAAWGME